jgi:hypothetical protein
MQAQDIKRVKSSKVEVMCLRYVTLTFIDMDLTLFERKILGLMFFYSDNKGMLNLTPELKTTIAARLKTSENSLKVRTTSLFKDDAIIKIKREWYSMNRFFHIDETTVIDFKTTKEDGEEEVFGL